MPPGRPIPRVLEPRQVRAPGSEAIPQVRVPPELDRAGAELASLVGDVRACRACSRESDNRCFGSGSPQAPLFLLKDRPSADDLRAETAFVEEAEPLDRAFARLQIPLSWVYGTTAVRCSTRAASTAEARACASHLLVELEAVQPRVLVVFGQRALDAVVALDGRCGIVVPGEVRPGAVVELRSGLQLLVTERLPEGLHEPEAKQRLWRDLQLAAHVLASGA